MKFRITTLTRTDSGTYDESGDILPDLLNGSPCPANMGEMLDWLSDLGYREASGFRGWGTVVAHEDDGSLLSITERPDLTTAAAALGRKGGGARTDAKAAAARENGRKGGRPKTITIPVGAVPAIGLDGLREYFVGWSRGDGSGSEGYSLDPYFDSSGRYLGPDEHGIEPLFRGLKPESI